MPEESISKRLAAKLKVTGKAKAGNNLSNNQSNDQIDRPFSIEQKSELARASNVNEQQAKSKIDGIRSTRPLIQTRSANFGDDFLPEDTGDERPDSIQPADDLSNNQDNQTNNAFGIKENKELQNAHLYRPESMSPASSEYSLSANINVNQPQPNTGRNVTKNLKTKATNNAIKRNAGKLLKDSAKKLAGVIKAIPPAAWPWIIGILAILIALLLLTYFISNSLEGSPAKDGKSQLVQVDPIADKEWVKKILMLSGDKDVANLLKEESAASLKTNLESIKTLIQNDATIPTSDKETYAANINNLILKVDEAVAASNESTKKQKVAELKNAINELIKSLTSVTPLPTTLQTRTPLKEPVVRFNTHPHLGTLGWPSTTKPKDYDSPARTYLQTGEGTCDAVDLKVGGNVSVFAAFSGKIVRQGGAWGIENDQYKAIAIYGHIDLNSGYSADREVKEGEMIGKTQESQGHLHFELAVNKGNGWKCVANTKPEVIAQENAGWPEHQLGKSLWEKILLVLHSPNSPE